MCTKVLIFYMSYHRVIIDGPGSTTVFNGGEAMTDLLYTRYNNFIEGKLLDAIFVT